MNPSSLMGVSRGLQGSQKTYPSHLGRNPSPLVDLSGVRSNRNSWHLDRHPPKKNTSSGQVSWLRRAFWSFCRRPLCPWHLRPWQLPPRLRRRGCAETKHVLVQPVVCCSMGLGVDSPVFSTIALFKKRICFPWVFGWIPEKKDPWKEWGR